MHESFLQQHQHKAGKLEGRTHPQLVACPEYWGHSRNVAVWDVFGAECRGVEEGPKVVLAISLYKYPGVGASSELVAFFSSDLFMVLC